ncbi:MAG: hypothetical protein CL808_06455 [Citromicrobium sp.]|nr:hypothetical protein [Citromicrobium sp.]
MGFYSWLTADTHEPINNRYSRTPHERPVYLLRPDGPPIEERAYEGYGVFGGHRAEIVLATMNLPEDHGLGTTDLFFVGSLLSTTSGVYHTEHPGFPLVASSLHVPNRAVADAIAPFIGGGTIRTPFARYDEPLEAFEGRPPNFLTRHAFWQRAPWTVPRPLKFSFDPAARYGDLPASPGDPNQGYFF